MAADLAFGLAAAGWTVVSGLARGIDAAAHRGALEARGATVAVLGCGVDRGYPASNRDLRRAITRDGLLLTEFPPGTPPLKHHFPQRNRIIAALADGVVVVQAGLPSGALITVRHANDLGLEVLAVPGPADQAVSRGTHRLLQEGAALVTCAADVLAVMEELPCVRGGNRDTTPETLDRAGRGPGPRGPAQRALAGLLEGPATLDEVAAQGGMSLQEAVAALGRLELRGLVRALPGLRYERVERSSVGGRT
jgi:DNA processing protein